MSSPYRGSPGAGSSSRSTPSRSLTNGSKRVNGYHGHPLRSSINDSPSRQLLEEFSLMLLNDDRSFRTSLDEQTAAQHRLHVEALDRALAKHESVRESAERARERVELEIETERQRREDEEKAAVERARRELEAQKLAEQKRQLEEQQARDEVKRQQETLKREQEEAKRKADAQRQQELEEKQRKERQEKEEADKKAREEAEAKERAQQAEKERQAAALQASQPAPQTNGNALTKPTPSAAPPAAVTSSEAPVSLPAGSVSTAEQREAEHKAYLDLHQRLKQLRSNVADEVKKNPRLKEQVSEWRRTINKCLGQLSKGATAQVKENNRRALNQIVAQLDEATKVTTPSVDVTQYLVRNQQPQGADTQYPAILLFLLNHFAKSLLRQMIAGVKSDLKEADSIGVVAVTIFARTQTLINGQSLIDILWAKYHKLCPVLFGISGNEATKEGRIRIGWRLDGGFVREQEHLERMSALGAGFAAITLRDFSKSRMVNPAPNRLYWESLARIVNTPKPDTQPTHFIVLKAMIQNYVPRIISTFGGAGVAALRLACVTFPAEKGPQDEKGRKVPAVTAVLAMPTILQQEYCLTL